MTVKHYILVLILGAVLISCQDIEDTEKPDDLIAEEKMVNVLVDMLKVSATQNYSDIQYRKRGVNAKELVFEKYGIDSLELRKSTTYYSEHFEINERIYDSVRERLRRRDTKLDSLVERQKKADFKKNHPTEKSRKVKGIED